MTTTAYLPKKLWFTVRKWRASKRFEGFANRGGQAEDTEHHITDEKMLPIADLLGSRLRPYLWGIASVIILVGLGRGFVVDQKKHMDTLGKDLVIVWGGRTSSQVGGRAAGREIRLNVDDATQIRGECYM